MQYVIASSIEKLYTFSVSPDVLVEFGNIMDGYMGLYIDQKFHALKILEENEGFARQMMENFST